MRAEDITSIDSEAGIIASLIHNPELAFHSEHLFPNHFAKKDNGYVYTAICSLARRGIKTVDPYNILESLESSEATRGYVSELSVERLNELMDMSDILARRSVEEYKMLVANVMDAAFRRDTFTKLRDCQALCYNRSEVGVERKIYDIIDDVMTEYSVVDDIPMFCDVADDLWADIERHQDGNESGIPFKFHTLNEYVRIESGELVVLGAPAKGAKSMFMLNEAVDILRQGKSVMYIDSELSSRLFLCRLVSHLTGIEFNRVRSGRYDAAEAEKIKEQIAWIKQQKLVHMYMPIFQRDTIYTAVKRIDHQFGHLDVLIVDYLKSTGDADAYATYAELGKLTDMIKNDLAGKMDIAALAAAQLNTAGKLADSAKIARNASTIVVMLDKTPEEIEADGVECGNKKLIVQLNRNGMQHASGEYIDIFFNGNVVSLEEAKQHIPDTPY